MVNAEKTYYNRSLVLGRGWFQWHFLNFHISLFLHYLIFCYKMAFHTRNTYDGSKFRYSIKILDITDVYFVSTFQVKSEGSMSRRCLKVVELIEYFGSPGVNFNNVLQAVFCTNLFCTAFLYLQFVFVMFCQSILVIKLLVKCW